MDKDIAEQFALEWVEAWNSHDLDKILAHYADDFTMHSPIIKVIAGEPSGILHGKAKIRAYWSKALEQIPNLHFELIQTYCGANSVVINYVGHRGVVAEVFVFNDAGKVAQAFAHYE